MNSLIGLGPVADVSGLCAALGLSRATYYRDRRQASVLPAGGPVPQDGPGVPAVAAAGAGLPQGADVPEPAVLAAPSVSAGDDAPPAAAEMQAVPAVPRPPKVVPRALTTQERDAVLALLNGPRFCDMSPGEVYAALLDDGLYHCSERTMYRILAAHAEVKERRDQRRHPVYAAPELLATRPNQVWSWDITKLRGPGKGDYFHLYVILDLYSRYVVGWMVSASESAVQAEQFIDETCTRHAIPRDHLTIHADRGTSMKSQAVTLLLADLGVIKSHSRPSVSDDNPYSEVQFKTLKYRPDFPDYFGSLQDARAHCQRFFTWYNTEHHHVGIGLLTPHDVFTGNAAQVISKRASVLDAAYAGHPERFVNKPPIPLPLPGAVWINRPKNVAATTVSTTGATSAHNTRSVVTSENTIVKIGGDHLRQVSPSEMPIV